ncbi:HNH endonuclease [Vibrio europaeus]|uniref:HNH endonuclease n=1 Tax=Vibrio europaeus TaxID=300876 RepID=A0ABT5GT49_9VIBR|nr:HNH endonuclease signature motif containing protein [Vibrio europaeus]MDC5703455.1 HNH endonuclease signature motif containing protein [Vibrio europaeus]MDC5711390.1 HNH endonuclease [Vibrio europaeus]MDC5714883.1 HNH endonuclease [Vibrio europaeus]MDC5727501.1 HNH endonuclease [Vibrio europaeus]MDC5729722.1 HNH endonuclease [Vibrio europaeus]
MPFHQLVSGTKLDNQQLCEVFGCSPQGGMRRSHKTNALVIISNHIKSIYDDRWDGELLHYTGMGSNGDQSLSFAQNKTLAESNVNNVGVHLFEVFKDKEYTYVGQVTLFDKPYTEQQPGDDGVHRQVFVFPLQVAKQDHRVVSAEDKAHVEQVRVRKATRLATSDLKIRALNARTKPGKLNQSVTQYERNVWVSELAKRLAGGICQLCEQPAPFKNKKGEPYLETHHIEWLAKGGADSTENTVALCPNCHRKMHALNLDEDIKHLKERVTQLLSREDS